MRRRDMNNLTEPTIMPDGTRLQVDSPADAFTTRH